jgi:ribonuclease-3
MDEFSCNHREWTRALPCPVCRRVHPIDHGHAVSESESSPHSIASDIQLVDDSGQSDGTDNASKIAQCQQIVRYEFKDEALLLGALTHASGVSNRLASNERLEFLGDAVLGLTVCQWLYEEYPEYSEGDLTKIKSAVVSRRACGKIACALGLDRCLIVGRGVTRNRSFPRSLVSDVFESVVAAIYLDGGAEIVAERIKEWLRPEVRLAVETQGAGNFKSSLQQYAQREMAATPVYRLVRESGPDHHKSFMVAAVIADRQFSGAWGSNKKDAEQRAASNALAELHDQPLPFPEEG